MVSGSDSTHVGVTRPMNFEKNYDLFFAKSCFRDFSEPSCHSSSFIDLAKTALANIRSVKTICMVSGSDSTHVGVTGPMNFEKNYDLFFAKSCFRDFSEPSCHSSSFIDLANTALANIRSVKTICMFSASDSTHMVVTSPVNSKQPVRFFFCGNHGPGILRSLVAIQTLLLTSQTLSWQLDVPQIPYAWIQGTTVPIWMSLVR